jgi:molecular chaperone DnaK (HSP70)
MVVVGIDFGCESCVVSAVLKQRVEVLENDYFERKTP